jgi:hypothetical protein
MMMPLHIAQKLQALAEPGTMLSASLMRHPVVDKLLADGILQKRQLSNSKSKYFLPDAAALKDYLQNQFTIGNLDEYVSKLKREDMTRGDAVEISGDSKLKGIRSFTGFLANVLEPMGCTMAGAPFLLNPLPGCFTFISDYAQFVPHPSYTIVGIENQENFRLIESQRHLFAHIKPLFVSRYPQGKDLVRWLQGIPNPYLHFGDLDFAGINIYLYEYKKHLGERAKFFVPPKTEELLVKHGRRWLYNVQVDRAVEASTMDETDIVYLLELIHRHKMGLEQEIFTKEG